MPCRYDDYDLVHEITTKEFSKLKCDLDNLTRMLCSLCKYLDISNINIEPENVKTWWIEHKRKDEERLRLETEAKIRQEAEEKENKIKKFKKLERQYYKLKKELGS